MEILGIIPARGGSKGISRKNLALINNQPLLFYTASAALKSNLSRVILTTDDNEIAQAGSKLGLDVPFLRPKSLSCDNTPLEPVLMHTLDILLKVEKYAPDAIVLLHPTSPLREIRHINEAIDIYVTKKPDSVVSVSPPMQHPEEMVCFLKTRMKFLLDIDIINKKKQRQQYTDCYFLNGAIYIINVYSFKQSGNRFGNIVIPYLMNNIDSIDINTLEDLFIAESILIQRDKLKNK